MHAPMLLFPPGTVLLCDSDSSLRVDRALVHPYLGCNRELCGKKENKKINEPQIEPPHIGDETPRDSNGIPYK